MTTIQQIRQQQILSKSTIDLNNVLNKFVVIELLSNRKINLTYGPLKKPKIRYYYTLKDNDQIIRQINKTEFDNLKTDLDLRIMTIQTEKLIDISLFERFKDKDYMHLNYLSNHQKIKIKITELWLNSQYLTILDFINEL